MKDPITYKIIYNVLLKKIKELDTVQYDQINVDKNSFLSGYSNGFVSGFYFARKIIIILLIVLTISLFL